MNNLLLLIILVSIICLMNNKDLMKSVSTKAKSMNMDDTTLLVVVFVVVVLFMCMSKKVEGFSELNDLNECDENAPNKHNLSVVDDNNTPSFNYVTLCLTGPEKELFTRNGPVTNRSRSNETLPIRRNRTRLSDSVEPSDMNKPSVTNEPSVMNQPAVTNEPVVDEAGQMDGN